MIKIKLIDNKGNISEKELCNQSGILPSYVIYNKKTFRMVWELYEYIWKEIPVLNLDSPSLNEFNQVWIISVKEAKEKLIDWYVNTLINDKPFLRELLKGGELGKWAPNFHTISEEKVVDLFCELDVVADMIKEKTGFDEIMIRMSNDNLVSVWKKEEFFTRAE